ncbi:MAG: hypothetical protein HWN70_12225, partial [Desulfobacterales bacterium]|nr:hypothetical protein [Desulfobacterales bacterium]
ALPIYQQPPDYPTYDQATAYAEDFRNGAPFAYQKSERHARYWLSSTLDVLTTFLRENTYALLIYPPAGLEIAYASDIEDCEHFRGWIVEYDIETESWTLLVSSQEVGIDEFKRIRREYKTS